MNYKEIKGVKHFIYSLTEWEIKYPKSKLESWRVGQEGDWVLTDDNHVVQILKKAKYGKLDIVRCVTGTYKINGKQLMGSDIPDNIYSFSKENIYDSFKNRKNSTSKEFLFAKYIAKGEGAVESYLKAYKTENKDYAHRRANELLKSERVRNMVTEEIKAILDSEGVTPNYIIQTFKQVSDLADRDTDRLRALESLAKIAGLFETEKKSEQLTVFAGFTDEQMKAISNGKSQELKAAGSKKP
jgi:hypothetical protein